MKQQFIGFDSLEKLLAAATHLCPLNALPVVHPGRGGKYGISIHTQLILVSQVQANGEVLYCRIITGRYQALAGSHEPRSEGKNYQARSESAWQIVAQEMLMQGFNVRQALIAIPQNLQLLDGYADCLKYNKKTDLYERRDASKLEV